MTDALAPCLPPVDPETLARTLNSLFMGFQIIGFDWKYLYVNTVAAAHGNTTPEALIGRGLFEAFPGIEDQEPLMSLLRRAMAERTGHVFEHEFTFPDGTKRWFQIRIEPVPEGICVYSVDINERRLEEERLRAQLVALQNRPPLLKRIWRALTSGGQS